MRKIVAVFIVFACLSTILPACGSEDVYFIICHPESYVCVRNSPKKGNNEAGRFDCGDYVRSDGVKKNGYLHITEAMEGDGWVYAGNVVQDQPVIEKQKMRVNSNSNVICRRSVGGKKVGILTNGDVVTVYARSEEWAVTDKGYIMTEFLEVENE